MLKGLGGWLRKLIRGDADHKPQQRHIRAGDSTSVQQHNHAPGAIQFAHVSSVQVIQAAGAVDSEFQALQVQVLRMLDASGDKRSGIEAFMQREFGTNRLSHLSQQQLVRVQRYCEVVESRRGRRSPKANARQGGQCL